MTAIIFSPLLSPSRGENLVVALQSILARTHLPPPLMAFSKEKNTGGQSRAPLSSAGRRGNIAKYKAEREDSLPVTGLISDDNWNKTRANYRYCDLVPVLEIRLSIEKSWWVFLVWSQCWNVSTRPTMFKCFNVIIHQTTNVMLAVRGILASPVNWRSLTLGFITDWLDLFSYYI